MYPLILLKLFGLSIVILWMHTSGLEANALSPEVLSIWLTALALLVAEQTDKGVYYTMLVPIPVAITVTTIVRVISYPLDAA